MPVSTLAASTLQWSHLAYALTPSEGGLISTYKGKPGLQPAPLSCEEGGREGPHGVTSPGLTPYYVYKGPARPCYVYKVQLDQVFISRLPCASKG